jgi:DNA-binding response OmpR family regulator
MRHILLIEDEKDHADLIRRALANATSPCRISHVETLSAGRALAEQDPPGLALVDYRLPDGSGDEFVRWSADRFPGRLTHGVSATNAPPWKPSRRVRWIT